MNDTGEEFREPTAEERALLSRLLATAFERQEALQAQLEGCKVKAIDGEGSLKIHVEGGVRAIVRNTVPVEAEAEDEDGAPLHALLHIHKGLLDELEFLKDAEAPIQRQPPADRWRVVVLPPPPPLQRS